jgi:hypothetical protein
MSLKPFDIQTRIPIWKALSLFYLDTELQDSDFQGIAEDIINSPYTFEEVKMIDKYEVFPVLKYNILQVAGEWVGFEEDWLVENITLKLKNDSKFRRLGIDISYWMCRNLFTDYWLSVETTLNKKDP